MQNINPGWRSFLQNTLIYFIALGIIMGAFRVFHFPWLLAFMWLTALVGIGVLAFQANRLLAMDSNTTQVTTRLQNYLTQTREYRKQIEQVLQSADPNRASTARQETLRARVEHWTAAVEDLVQRVDALQQNPVIQRDLKTVPLAINDLETKLTAEIEDDIRQQLAHTLETRRKQWQALQTLQRSIRRAEIQIESTLSMLGTIYSQLLTSQSTSQVADYSRLAADVDEEVLRLEDHLTALREVTLGRSNSF